MSRRKFASLVTVPEMERVGARLARLYPKHSRMKVSGGSYMEAWLREDDGTIAAALGAYTQDRPKRQIPAALLLLRCWPEGLRDQQRAAITVIVNRLLERRFRPKWRTMPPKVQEHVTGLLDSGKLARILLDEFTSPSPCWKCQGKGDVLRITDDNGNYVAPKLVQCPLCNGVGEGPRGFRLRAEQAGLSPYYWRTFGQPVYERTLHGLRFMSDHAGKGVLNKLE